MGISTKQIGDGKLPNKFWVSISEDYLFFDEESKAWHWVSDVFKSFQPKGETVAVLPTYRGAREYIDSYFAMGCEYGPGITVNCITIEDRISGELYSSVYHLNPADPISISYETHEDLSFTKERDPNFK